MNFLLSFTLQLLAPCLSLLILVPCNSAWGTNYLKSDSEKIANALNLTVVDTNRAQQIFSDLISTDIPFAFPDGCHAKAQKTAMLLEDEGIISAKAFVEGNLFYKTAHWGEQFWIFHVAPIIAVKSAQNVQIYVLDPLLFNKPVLYGAWLAKLLSNKKTTIKEKYFSNRFVYSYLERNTKPTGYVSNFIEDMEIVINQARTRLDGIGGK